MTFACPGQAPAGQAIWIARRSPAIRPAFAGLAPTDGGSSGYHLVVTHDAVVFDHHVVHRGWHDRGLRVCAREPVNGLHGRPLGDDEKLDSLGHGATEYGGVDEPWEP